MRPTAFNVAVCLCDACERISCPLSQAQPARLDGLDNMRRALLKLGSVGDIRKQRADRETCALRRELARLNGWRRPRGGAVRDGGAAPGQCFNRGGKSSRANRVKGEVHALSVCQGQHLIEEIVVMSIVDDGIRASGANRARFGLTGNRAHHPCAEMLAPLHE